MDGRNSSYTAGANKIREMVRARLRAVPIPRADDAVRTWSAFNWLLLRLGRAPADVLAAQVRDVVFDGDPTCGWDEDNGRLFLPLATRVSLGLCCQIYAHEAGHALDLDDERWPAIWQAEICAPHMPLNEYATTTAREGYAEFFRLAVSNSPKAKMLFPGCHAFMLANLGVGK